MSAALQLLTELRAAGLTVKEVDGWAQRGSYWEHDFPIGILQHHTAPPVPFPVDNLAGLSDGRIKCNANTKPDGTVWLVAYRSCNYSSGGGSSVVRDSVIAGIPPTANAADRGLVDDESGNDLFWNFENDHAGDGGPLPEVQRRAIATASHVVAHHFGLTHLNVISHAEWTKRKIDPRWNGSNRIAIDQIRNDMRSLETMQGPNGEPNYDQVSDWAKGSWSWAWDQDPKLISPDSHPQSPVTVEQMISFLERYDENDH